MIVDKDPQNIRQDQMVCFELRPPDSSGESRDVEIVREAAQVLNYFLKGFDNLQDWFHKKTVLEMVGVTFHTANSINCLDLVGVPNEQIKLAHFWTAHYTDEDLTDCVSGNQNVSHLISLIRGKYPESAEQVIAEVTSIHLC